MRRYRLLAGSVVAAVIAALSLLTFLGGVIRAVHHPRAVQIPVMFALAIIVVGSASVARRLWQRFRAGGPVQAIAP